ncbi:hypothetical protein I553_7212 [Mycobacterium xenopi 4042]|uniref:Uncharacterized protein n=1 Tax=Mycobacterium xenopi 4042 TaxID=1299334 RepID=X7Z612_MYCXE|nr:hypothetical protein I553_7212 [Mycobacterium xenopi 4042]
MPHALVRAHLGFDFGHFSIIAHYPLVLPHCGGHPFTVGVLFTPLLSVRGRIVSRPDTGPG